MNNKKKQEETREMRTTEITVESKDKTSSGMSCITYGIMTSCEENFKYKINNFDTSKSIFESVEIGKNINVKEILLEAIGLHIVRKNNV